MKKLLILIALFATIGCSKELTSSNRTEYTTYKGSNTLSGYYYGNIRATETSVTGVRTTTDAVRLNAGRSISITAYTNTGTFCQTGFHNSGSGTVPFSQFWLNGVMYFPPLTLINAPATFFNIGQRQTFGLISRNDSVITTIDGHECIAYYVPNTFFNNVELYTENTSARFSATNFYPAIEVDNNGWGISASAICTQVSWGVEGQNQRSSLRFGEVNIGGSIKTKPLGEYVWGGL